MTRLASPWAMPTGPKLKNGVRWAQTQKWAIAPARNSKTRWRRWFQIENGQEPRTGIKKQEGVVGF